MTPSPGKSCTGARLFVTRYTDAQCRTVVPFETIDAEGEQFISDFFAVLGFSDYTYESRFAEEFGAGLVDGQCMVPHELEINRLAYISWFRTERGLSTTEATEAADAVIARLGGGGRYHVGVVGCRESGLGLVIGIIVAVVVVIALITVGVLHSQRNRAVAVSAGPIVQAQLAQPQIQIQPGQAQKGFGA